MFPQYDVIKVPFHSKEKNPYQQHFKQHKAVYHELNEPKQSTVFSQGTCKGTFEDGILQKQGKNDTFWEAVQQAAMVLEILYKQLVSVTGYEGGWDEQVLGEMSVCLQGREKIQCMLFNYKTQDRINCRIMRGEKTQSNPEPVK